MVKFLHTADWHIGRKLQGLDLLEDQQFVLENLITEMKKIKNIVIKILDEQPIILNCFKI